MVKIRLEKIVYSPSLVFFAVWFFSISSYSGVFSFIALETLLYFLSFFLFFLFGELLGLRFKVVFPGLRIIGQRALRNLCIVLILIAIFYSSQLLLYIFSGDSLSSSILGIRNSNLSGDPVIKYYNFYVGAIQLLFGIGLLAYLINYYKHNNRGNAIYLFCIWLALITSLFDGSRAFFLVSVVWFLVLSVIISNIKLGALFVYLAAVLLLFSLTFSIFRPVSEGLSEGAKYTAIYLSGGVGALEFAIRNEVTVYWQDLESILNKFVSLGLPFESYDLSKLRMEFVDLDKDYQTNVFTALGVYIQYFGYLYPFVAFIYGFIGGYLSFLCRRIIAGKYLYSLFLCTLIFSLFHEYVLSLSYYLIKIFLVVIFFGILARLFRLKVFYVQ